MTTVSLDNSKVKRVISNIRNLPTPPIVFHQMQKVINDPKVSATHIASILAEDPAMSVKVLKLTNSAFYGLSREVDSVKQAVIIVGLEAIKNLVLSASVLDMFKGNNIDQEFQEAFWRHSLATAFGSRLVARSWRTRGMVDSDAAFSAGLLHDIGKMVLACFLHDEYAAFISERKKDRENLDYEVEERALGFNHAQIGGLLAVQWKIPAKLGEAITYHHHPQLSEIQDSVCYVVAIADYIAKKTFYDAAAESHLIGTADPGLLEYMQLTGDDLRRYGDALREEYLKAQTFMQMAGITA
jgi:putative nucleotidyltransferase with HDIG domain